MASTTVASALLSALLLFATYVAYERFWSPLSGLPGPFSASISKLWLIKHTRQGRINRDLIELHSKHGTLVRIGPNEVSITDPSAVKKIYGSSSV